MGVCPKCGRRVAGYSFCPEDGGALVADEAAAPEPPRREIDRYRLLREVGRGAMGIVFEAEHIHIGKRLALKLLHADLARDPLAVERMRREARTASSIGHPNIVNVEDFGIAPDGAAYLVMEWLAGETLADRIERGPVAPDQAIALVRQICGGLAAAHVAGVIHRDLKPANMFLLRHRDGREHVKLLDFGIAKLTQADSRLTRTGSFVGTPDYVAPEQALGDEIDARADLYSVGILLYRLLTNSLPFRGESFMAVLHQHTMNAPEPPSRRAPERAISPALEAVIMRCLEKRPEDRFSSAEELDRALAAVQAGEPVIAPRARRPVPQLYETAAGERLSPPRRGRAAFWAALALVILAALGAAAFVHLRSDHDHDHHPVQVPPDAAPRPAADAAPVPPAPSTVWKFHDRGKGFDYTVRVDPARVAPGQRFSLEVEILPGPGLRRSWLDARPEAEITITHFEGHVAVHRGRYSFDQADTMSAALALERPGKHHVALELVAGERRLGTARFDLCIGADPASPGPALERICPRMSRPHDDHQ